MAAISNTSLMGDSNLQYYVKLDGNTTDSGPNSIAGTATNISYTDGKYGQAAAFNGITSVIDVAANAALNFGANSFSVSFWVYPTDVNHGDQDWVGRRNATNAYFIFRIKNGGDVLIQLYTDGGNNLNYTYGSVAFANNSWYHVVVVIDRVGGKMYWYLNGVIVNSGGTAITGSPTLTSDFSWRIAENLFSGIYPVGYVDDLDMFDRVLTAAEVSYLYNESSYLDLTSKVW